MSTSETAFEFLDKVKKVALLLQECRRMSEAISVTVVDDDHAMLGEDGKLIAFEYRQGGETKRTVIVTESVWFKYTWETFGSERALDMAFKRAGVRVDEHMERYYNSLRMRRLEGVLGKKRPPMIHDAQNPEWGTELRNKAQLYNAVGRAL